MIGKLFRKTPLAWLQLIKEKNRLLVAISGIAFAKSSLSNWDFRMLCMMGQTSPKG